MKDFVRIVGDLTDFIENERIASYNEGVDAMRQAEGRSSMTNEELRAEFKKRTQATVEARSAGKSDDWHEGVIAGLEIASEAMEAMMADIANASSHR